MIDYEKVDMALLSLIQQLNSFQNFVSVPHLSSMEGVREFVFAIDAFRKKISEEIEKQGAGG